METHFTYKSDLNDKTLEQGDLLKRTKELDDLLTEVHPYYLKASFKYFIVLTQSCDLVLRKGKCKTDYISIAAVIPFDRIVEKEVETFQNNDIERKYCLCDIKKRTNMYQLVEKIFNNNHKDFFYLHEDATRDLQEQCCAHLRLSIAIRSHDHYQMCLKAKFLELENDFRAKLGWLVGDLYSRVGTTDWAPDNIPATAFKTMINTAIDSQILWKPKSVLRTANIQIEKILTDNTTTKDETTIEKIHTIVNSIEIPSNEDKKKQALGVIKSKISTDTGIDPKTVEKIMKLISNDPVFTSNFK